MKLLVVLIVTLCIAHGIRGQGLLGGIIGGAANLVGGAANLLGGAVEGAAGVVGGAAGAVGGAANLVGGTLGATGKAIGDILGGGNVGILDGGNKDPCSQDALPIYQQAQINFYKKLYARIAARSDNHFVFSPFSIWLSLSALAEGADLSIQSQLLASLNLPQQKCVRNKFYEIASHVEEPGRDVNINRRRSLILDEGLELNPAWAKYIANYGLLSAALAPIKSNPGATQQWLKNYLEVRSDIPLRGNSIFVDRFDYQALWTTSFSDSYIAPFYNDFGQKIGSVEMMKAKKRVRLAYIPLMNTKFLELPVGNNGRYTMLFALGNGNNFIRSAAENFLGAIYSIFNELTLSAVPVDIAVPKFVLNSEFDLRPAFEDIGIDRFWSDPAATRYATYPAALPGSYLQRASISIGSGGVEPYRSSQDGLLPGLVDLMTNTVSDVTSVVGRNFVADRPFMFALFDTKTRTCIFAGAYSKPNTW